MPAEVVEKMARSRWVVMKLLLTWLEVGARQGPRSCRRHPRKHKLWRARSCSLTFLLLRRSSTSGEPPSGASSTSPTKMSRDQRDTLGVFASRDKDKFSQVEWHEGDYGSPMITNSAASIEVEIKERFQALTHTVFIGRVLSAEASESEPLIYKAGKFYDSLNLDSMD